MANNYIPKPNDVVFMDGRGFVPYVVVDVDQQKQTARVKNVGEGPIGLTDGVPWSNLHNLDESQNAVRIIREATEGR